MTRLTAEPVLPDTSHIVAQRIKPGGFRVTVECLEDGERVSFSSHRLPWGLSVSPTLAGKKVAAVLANYLPEGKRR